MSKKTIPALAALLLLAGLAAWHWWPLRAPTSTPPPAVPATEPLQSPPPVVHPLPQPDDAARLPELAASDEPFAAALTSLPNAGALRNLLRPATLIRHIVATVDNLPRHRLAVELRPLRGAAGPFLAVGDDHQATIDAGNAARYAPVMQLVRDLDLRALNTLYRRYYPLFQRAYQDLGYPNGYFNDRLVSVIDHLLATPQPSEPVGLVRPKVYWEYADPELEARSAGQKLLLRVGSANAALIRERLRDFRALITSDGLSPTRDSNHP